MKGSCYFFFHGYYFVAAASELLDKHHISNRIVKAPVKLNNGCAFAVMTRTADADESSRIFEQNGVTVEHKIKI